MIKRDSMLIHVVFRVGCLLLAVACLGLWAARPFVEARAQTVTVTGEADVSVITDRIDAMQTRLDAIDARVSALEGTLPPQPAGPMDDEPPNPSSRVIGMNLGFVGRGDHPDKPDTAGYDDLLRPVAAVVRFMNPNRINDDMRTLTSIDQPHYYQSQTYRQALTWQAELCRRVGADYYLNVPINASPQWVTEAVGLIRSILDEERIYVTWANEVWNSGLGPYREVKRIVGTDAGAGKGLAFFAYWARRLDETWAAARQADPTCIRVFETKTADDGVWWTDRVHERLSSDYEAVAITLYFSPSPSDLREQMTVDDVFDAARRHWERRGRRWQQAGIAWALDHGKRAISYEGGQHFVDYQGRPTLVETLRRCQLDPRITDLRRDVLDAAVAAGLDLHIEYDFVDWWNRYGYWGQAETVAGLHTSLKYRELVRDAQRLGGMR